MKSFPLICDNISASLSTVQSLLNQYQCCRLKRTAKPPDPGPQRPVISDETVIPVAISDKRQLPVATIEAISCSSLIVCLDSDKGGEIKASCLLDDIRTTSTSLHYSDTPCLLSPIPQKISRSYSIRYSFPYLKHIPSLHLSSFSRCPSWETIIHPSFILQLTINHKSNGLLSLLQCGGLFFRDNPLKHPIHSTFTDFPVVCSPLLSLNTYFRLRKGGSMLEVQTQYLPSPSPKPPFGPKQPCGPPGAEYVVAGHRGPNAVSQELVRRVRGLFTFH